jgi:hypothetical protein
MKGSILILCILSLSKIGLAQTDYRKGYIITNTHDTVYGLVKYIEGNKIYRSCEFERANQDTVIYGPDGIAGYGYVDDKFFESKSIRILNHEAQSIFLEVLVRGAVTLYHYKNIFLIEKAGADPIELKNDPKATYVDGFEIMKKSNQHIVTLNILLSDCPELRQRIQKATLSEKSLTSLIEQYNKCKGVPTITYKGKKEWIHYSFGIMGGVTSSQLIFNNVQGYYKYLSGTYQTTTNTPSIGISLNMSLPRKWEHFSLQGDVIYGSFKYTNHYFNPTSGSPPYQNYASTDFNTVIEIHQLNIPVGIKYIGKGSKITPYFNTGFSATIPISSKSETTIFISDINGYNFTFIDKSLEIKPFQFGLWGGLGVLKSINKKKNAFLELRFEKTNGLISGTSALPPSLKSSIANFQITVGIRGK